MTPPLLRYFDSLLGILVDGGFSNDLGHHAMHVLGSRALSRLQPGAVRPRRLDRRRERFGIVAGTRLTAPIPGRDAGGGHANATTPTPRWDGATTRPSSNSGSTSSSKDSNGDVLID